MMKTKLGIAILVAAALAGSTFAAEAKSHKHKHHSSMTSGATKSDKSGDMAPSGQGNMGSSTTAPPSSGK